MKSVQDLTHKNRQAELRRNRELARTKKEQRIKNRSYIKWLEADNKLLRSVFRRMHALLQSESTNQDDLEKLHSQADLRRNGELVQTKKDQRNMEIYIKWIEVDNKLLRGVVRRMHAFSQPEQTTKNHRGGPSSKSRAGTPQERAANEGRPNQVP